MTIDVTDARPFVSTYSDAQLAEIAETTTDLLRGLALEVRWLRSGAQTALDELSKASHYAHHDPQGTAGANCPACHAMSRAREALRQ